MGPDELVQMGHIASMHYRDGLTRVEIAEELGISRFKVGRLLERARQLGIVKIEIEAFGMIDVELSIRLRQALGLKRALAVITSDQDEGILRDNLGSSTAQLLSEILGPEDVVGLAAGRTLHAMTSRLRSIAPCDCVGLSGLASPVLEHGTEVIRRFAQATHARSWPIFAPLLVESADIARSLRQDPHIAEAYRRFPQVTTALVPVGSLNPPDSQFYDSAHRLGIDHLLEGTGAVGEILSTVFTAQGEIINALDGYSLAMSTEQLRSVPEVIAVAGGATKHAAVLGAIRTGIIDSLVTDSALAQSLLQRVEHT